MKKIGVFGGTFDPPHLGHLLIAEQARQLVDEVWFIPSYFPPHKQPPMTEVKHRCEMVKLAIADNPYFQISEVEVLRGGTSYTVDTLQTLKDKHPFFTFFLILGADMVKDLHRWHKINKIFQLSNVIALGRVDVLKKSPDLEGKIIWVNEGVQTNISSTYVRQQLKKGLSVRYLIPDGVWYYIREHNLYEV